MNIGQLINRGYDILKNANIENYQLDCQLLLCKALKKDRIFVITNRDMNVSDYKVEMFFKFIELRKNKMPVKYILGESEFMGINFKLKKGVLIPRPETEVLVEQVIKDVNRYSYSSVCDLCCGSGVIGLSIASFVEDVQICCCDISDKAIELSNENLDNIKIEEKIKRVEIIKSDLLDFALIGNIKFDVIVCNPPYIKSNDIEFLMEDVKYYEPYNALCGGEDGLDFYRKIVFQSTKVLNSGGLLAFEIGYDQGEVVQHMLLNSGFKNVECIKDLSGNDRIIKGIIDL